LLVPKLQKLQGPALSELVIFDQIDQKDLQIHLARLRRIIGTRHIVSGVSVPKLCPLVRRAGPGHTPTLVCPPSVYCSIFGGLRPKYLELFGYLPGRRAALSSSVRRPSISCYFHTKFVTVLLQNDTL
jgi:hypothetical protein